MEQVDHHIAKHLSQFYPNLADPFSGRYELTVSGIAEAINYQSMHYVYNRLHKMQSKGFVIKTKMRVNYGNKRRVRWVYYLTETGRKYYDNNTA